MFLYRGRAEMLAVLTVLSLGNTQWDASTSQLLVTVSSQPATALAHRNRRGPPQPRIAPPQRRIALPLPSLLPQRPPAPFADRSPFVAISLAPVCYAPRRPGSPSTSWIGNLSLTRS